MKKKSTDKINPATADSSKKIRELEVNRESGQDEFLTTNHGVRINDNQNSVKAGERGPTLLEDFIMREKIMHFDHERIPERIVHARGAAAHGIFELYKPLTNYTKAGFLNDTSRQTPVFVRFSTVAGSRGSTDLARDVRGFSVKFYTDEGNYDLVGNNIPVFFIQDAMKFPDLVHAVKPEPHNEIPQAASAHDTFWDFISLMPESAHMIMWLMSDRAIPRSYRMMEGFGVHTFRLINVKGKASFVKFHWKPLLGVHSVAWDEAQKISGKDPDFHRRDLWEAIENGHFPEWELGLQIVAEEDEHRFGFDLLDPTKIIPEELVPVQRVGKLTLNRNPDNFFAETEQVAFHPGHIVPGIDFTNDPLLQGRLFSYSDTQLSRLGSPNFHEIPINRPIAPVHNNQRDGHMRQTINTGTTSYDPNSIGNGCPFQAKMAQGGFTSHQERIDAHKIRERSSSFSDHFSQAKLFYDSQSGPEKNHLANAFTFELSKVERESIRRRMVAILGMIDKTLAQQVAKGLGIAVPKPEKPVNKGVGADDNFKKHEPTSIHNEVEQSSALSMANTVKNTIKSRKIAVLATEGVNGAELQAMKTAIEAEQASAEIVATHAGMINDSKGKPIRVNHTFFNTASVLFDAVYVPGGKASIDVLIADADAVHFINEAYRHCKPIAGDSEGELLLQASFLQPDDGVLINERAKAFVRAIAQHRFWEREALRKVPS